MSESALSFVAPAPSSALSLDKASSHPSQIQTFVEGAPQAQYSTLKKAVLLSIFCLSQFLDTFNTSSLFSAFPTLEAVLGITDSQSAWLVSAWQLSFASFLLMSGKISDVYNPKHAFVAGLGGLGIISLGTGFVHNKIALFILRAIGGIFGSLTIPSSLALIVQVFPEPQEQGRAIGIFGGFAAVGNVLGLVIGAILVEYASWRWIFWFATAAALPVAAVAALLIPQQYKEESTSVTAASKLRRLDIPGVAVLTMAIVLFIYALTTAPTSGWGSASVLAPLIISIAIVVAFFVWESRLPADGAAIPSNTWFLPNFSVLFAGALLPFFWWVAVFTVFTTLWQDVYRWSAISTALHMLPIGISALFFSFTGSFSRYISPKYLILSAQAMMVIGTILLAFADRPSRYWSHVFTGFIIGSSGTALTFTHTNIAIFRSAPVSMTGTVGAVFNSAIQIGSAVGLAVVTSIQTNIDGTNLTTFNGRRDAFWFTVAVVAVEFVATLMFYRPSTASSDAESSMSAVSEKSGSTSTSARSGTATASEEV